MNVSQNQNEVQIQAALDAMTKQRRRANILIGCLLFAFSVFLYLWIAINVTPSPWFPFNVIDRFMDYEFQWLNWFLAGGVGTFVYLLWEVAKNFVHFGSNVEIGVSVTGEGAQNKKIPSANFIGQTPWYLVNAIRGPLITMAVMLLITNASFAATIEANLDNVATNENQATLTQEGGVGVDGSTESFSSSADQPGQGNVIVPTEPAVEGAPSDDRALQENLANDTTALGIAVDLKNADSIFLAIVAFMLGFYNRLPYHLFETFAKRIFHVAYAEAYEEQKKPDVSISIDGPAVIQEHQIKTFIRASDATANK